MQAYWDYTRLLTRDYENQKILERCYTDPKRTQMPAQATIQKVYTTEVVVEEQEFAKSKNASGGRENAGGGAVPDSAETDL